jgi:NADPH2:quinone reductase
MAAAIMLERLTVQYLIRQIHNVAKGDTIPFHAAAGGVGLIACQWAKSLGGTVIGTLGSKEKVNITKAQGCHYPIIYTREDFVARVKQIARSKAARLQLSEPSGATFAQIDYERHVIVPAVSLPARASIIPCKCAAEFSMSKCLY